MSKKTALITTLVIGLLLAGIVTGLIFAEKKARELAVSFVEENTPWQLQLPEQVNWSIQNPSAITFVNAALLSPKHTALGLNKLAISINIKALFNNQLHIQKIHAKLETLQLSQQQITALKAQQANSPTTNSQTKPWLEKIIIDDIDVNIKHLQFTQQPLALSAQNSHINIQGIRLNMQQALAPQIAGRWQLTSQQLTLNNSHIDNIQLKGELQPLKLNAQLLAQWHKHQLNTQISANFNKGLNIVIKKLELAIKEFTEQQWQELKQLQASLQNSKESQNTDSDNSNPMLQALSVQALSISANSINLEQLALKLTGLQINLENLPVMQQQQWVYQTRDLPHFKAKASLKEGLYASQHLKNLSLAAHSEAKTLVLEHLSVALDNGEIKLQGQADLSEQTIPSTWQGELNQIDLHILTQNSGFPSTGIINAGLNASISNMVDYQNIIEYTKADIFAKGKDLKISNIDIDKLVSTIRSAREISWTDIGAIGFFGPIGLLYSTAASVGTGSIKPGHGTSHIKHLDVNASNNGPWVSFHENLIETEKNKISFKGQINHQSEAFKDFEIAFLNKYYCATFIQEITGTYKKPNISLTNLSAGFILNTAGDLLTLKPLRERFCKPYYQGELNTL